MLRHSPRALLLWVAAAAVALVTAVLVADSLAGLRAQERAFGRLREVVVATRDLPVGSTVAADDVEVRRLRGEAPAAGSLGDPDAATGRVVVVAVLAGTPVTGRHLARADRDGLDAVVPRGMRAMRVSVDGGVSVRAGDAVDVYATLDPALVGSGDPTVTVAAGVPVLAVDDHATDAVPADATGVTVLVSDAQAPRLAFAATTGAVTLALVPPEDAASPPLP